MISLPSRQTIWVRSAPGQPAMRQQRTPGLILRIRPNSPAIRKACRGSSSIGASLIRQYQNQWFLGCGWHASMGIAPEWTRNGAREAHGRRRTALRRCLEKAAPCRKRMVDLSPIALPTRLLTGCFIIHVSMPSRFWRGTASVWPASLSSSSAASQHALDQARSLHWPSTKMVTWILVCSLGSNGLLP